MSELCLFYSRVDILIVIIFICLIKEFWFVILKISVGNFVVF